MKKITGNEPINPTPIAGGDNSVVSLNTAANVGNIHHGLTIRQQFAMAANPDVDGFRPPAIEMIMERPIPSTAEYVETFIYFAEFKAKLKVIEADALINELNKSAV